MSASIFEVYNEQVFDLLSPTRGEGLELVHHSKGFDAQGAASVDVNSADDVMEVRMYDA